MSPKLIPVRIADDVFELSVESPNAAQALSAKLREAALVEDVVAGLSKVSVRFAPDRADDIHNWLLSFSDGEFKLEVSREEIEIAVQYGGKRGPDLEHVCQALGMSIPSFIDLHTSLDHSVDMIGFTPGFAYVSGLPRRLSVPRLSTPRPRVQAGSIGIAAAYTGLYALAGPGGWPLIGKTSEPLFDPQQESPFRLQPGQRLKFRAE